jgi:hypothetical protein
VPNGQFIMLSVQVYDRAEILTAVRTTLFCWAVKPSGIVGIYDISEKYTVSIFIPEDGYIIFVRSVGM